MGKSDSSFIVCWLWLLRWWRVATVAALPCCLFAGCAHYDMASRADMDMAHQVIPTPPTKPFLPPSEVPASTPAAGRSVANPTEGPATITRTPSPPDPVLPSRPSAQVVPRADTRALVLLYHNIDYSQGPAGVRPWNFEAQILKVRKMGAEIIPLSQLVSFLEGKIQLPKRVAVITIDDGARSFYRYAYPILVKHRVPFTLSIITKVAEQSRYTAGLSWAQLKTMLASGLCEIASHGHTHRSLGNLRDRAIRFELDYSRILLEQYTGVRPLVFAYPTGSTNSRVQSHTRAAGYRAALGVRGYTIDMHTSPFRIPRFEMRNLTSLAAMPSYLERTLPSWHRERRRDK